MCPLDAQTRSPSPLHAVYERPDDLSRRLVVADELLAAGDPRGEFIALQFESSARSRKRAQKLLQRHRAAWLGALEDVVVSGSDVWRHGFLVSAAVRLSGHRVDEPSWATVEDLLVMVSNFTPYELASPWLKSLRAVRVGYEPTRRWVTAREAQRDLAAVSRELERGGRVKLVTPHF
ncbi:MAG: hypothetical protein U0228_07850 [Myxococcaceae bacterium]